MCVSLPMSLALLKSCMEFELIVLLSDSQLCCFGSPSLLCAMLVLDRVGNSFFCFVFFVVCLLLASQNRTSTKLQAAFLILAICRMIKQRDSGKCIKLSVRE